MPGRIFSDRHRSISLDEIFLIANSMTRLEAQPYTPFSNNWDKWFKNDAGITAFSRNVVKSALGLAFMRSGSISEWRKSSDPLVKNIGDYSLLSSVSKYVIGREALLQVYYGAFKHLPNHEALIKAFITVFYSETGFQMVNHNSYWDNNDLFKPGKKYYFIHDIKNGQPDSNAFGFGQWLGIRLIDYFYFAISAIAKVRDPRKCGPEMLYHPVIMFAFSAAELSNTNRSYYDKIVSFCRSKKNITHEEAVDFVLTKIQGIDRSDKANYQLSKKIKNEKSVQALAETSSFDKSFSFKIS